MTIFGDQSIGCSYQQSKNQSAWYDRMASDPTEQRFFHGPEVSLWRGTSLSQTHTPSPTYMTPHATQEPQQTRQLPTSPPSIVILPSLTSFFPVAIETAGTWNQMVQEVGRRIALVTEDTKETVFLFQRLSIALQRGNVVFHSTFTTE